MRLQTSQIEQLRQLLNLALTRLYEEDNQLIQRGGMERSLAFRFALYFSESMKETEPPINLDIDLEYNKNGLAPKRTPRRPNGVVPDFLLHSRGDNEENTLVVEFKGWWNNEARENDIIKLEDFVHQEGEYMYGLGVLIELNKDYFTVEEFIDYTPE